MLALQLSRKTSVIALELGVLSLRGVQLWRGRTGWTVHHWINIEHEPASPQPPPFDYAAQLHLAAGPGSFTGERASLLLSPPEVEYKLLDVPAQVLERSPGEVRAALQFELDRQMPWPAAELEMAAWSVETNGGAGGNAMIVGARSSSVQQIVDVLAAENLDCVRADIVPNAMLRICTPTSLEAENGAVWGALDVGFRSCRLYLMHKGRPVFARVLRGGGRDLTETLARELHVEFRIAEQYKRIYGVKQTERGMRSVVGGLSRVSEEALPGILYAILRPTIDTLVSEIERSYRFVLGRLPMTTPTGPLFLIGGGARLIGFREVLAAGLGIPVSVPEARGIPGLSEVHAHPACNAMNLPTLASCLGLALLQEDA